jgi:K+-transporting ATPase KdpF subunit
VSPIELGSYVVAGLAALGLLVYLVVALLRPERF